MKQSYLTIWVSACLCMCLSLCGNVSAQGVTSFNIQRPDFVSAPEDLYVTLRDVSTSGTETGMEMYAGYNPEADRYEVYGLEISGNYLITVHYSRNEEYVYILPYSVQKYVVAEGTMTLDLRNTYHKCGITVKDYYGSPFANAALYEYPHGTYYSLNYEGKLLLYMPDGDYNFMLSASNYSSVKKSITMAGVDMNVVFAFDKHRKVDFKVKDQKGDAMGHANIRIEENETSYSVVTDEQGVATMFLADGNYNACLTVFGYMELIKKLEVNSSIAVVNLSYEGYKRVSAKVKNGADTNVGVDMLYLYANNGEYDHEYGNKRDYYYAPPGVYTYEVNFDATFSKRGMVKITDADIEKVFDFSDYKKAIIECGPDIYSIRVCDPKSEDEDGWSIYFPESEEGGERPVENQKTAEVYLPAGEYIINGHETPQTGMRINLTQSGQRFVYNTESLETVEVEVNFVNSPVDIDGLSSWYADFTPQGYTGSIYVSSYSRQLPAGNYAYSIGHDAYRGTGFSIQGTCHIDAGNNIINVDLKDYRRVNFKVLTPDGEETEYPVMEVFRNGQPILSAEGTHFLLEDGDYKVLAWEEGDTEVYQKWVSFTVSGADQNINVQFERANTSIAFAEVRNEDYEPVIGTEMFIAGKTPDYVHAHISLFTDIPCGENEYQILMKGSQVQAGVVTIKADETNDLTFFIESTATGMNDAEESKLVMIQSGDKLMLLSENGKLYSVSIYNMNGSKLLERNMSGDNEISIQSFGSGVYILKMARQDGVKTFKFMKK